MTTATTSTLTDRYVDAVLSRLPVKQRADIEHELRASIADAIDAYVAGGKDPTEAERAALTELGDPARLAARYTDRPLQLIGPALYPGYIRLLTAALCIVVPVVAGVVGFTHMAIGPALTAAMSTAVHVTFWTTLLFAVIERVPGLRPASARQWTPDTLPELPDRIAERSKLVKQIAWSGGFIALMFVVRLMRGETPWQDPSFYMLLGWVGAILAVTAVPAYMRWSVPAAIVRWLLTVAAAGLMVWLAIYHRLLDPLVDNAPGVSAEQARWIDLGVIAAAAIVAVWATASAATSFITRSWADPDWKSLLRLRWG